MNPPESIANKPFWLVANLTLKDEAALEKVKPLIAAVKKSTDNDEPGTLNYHILVDASNGLKSTVVEQYSDAKALEAHRNTEAYKALFADRSVFSSLEISFLEELKN